MKEKLANLINDKERLRWILCLINQPRQDNIVQLDIWLKKYVSWQSAKCRHIKHNKNITVNMLWNINLGMFVLNIKHI